ncbi:lasso peptide biosynthesis B2 protein [Priestia megaterium]|uniref:lasso peptide biosynthesis B2 protein n=1 Tax=Priestia megaterium TaxID=1404 RepID=UPI0025B01905|nr:lasso peptide biosynthesis B2 protein [Priestia megaterium]MDN3233553.1 lasso peptide biosynthesis B2 protein [Priestia megaterium]
MFKKLRVVLDFSRLYILLFLFDLELSKKGFTKTFEKYSVRYFNNTPNDQISQNVVEDMESFFLLLNIVCAWYPKKADCIHKTLIGYRVMHKKFALPVEMVIGVRKFPFEAHAWLRINQQNLFPEEETNHYKIIISSHSYIKEQ